jgi:hypothetical protein
MKTRIAKLEQLFKTETISFERFKQSKTLDTLAKLFLSRPFTEKEFEVLFCKIIDEHMTISEVRKYVINMSFDLEKQLLLDRLFKK